MHACMVSGLRQHRPANVAIDGFGGLSPLGGHTGVGVDLTTQVFLCAVTLMMPCHLSLSVKG